MFDWLTKFFSFDEMRFEEGSLPAEEELQLAAVSMLVEVASAKGELSAEQTDAVESFFEGEYGSQSRAAVRDLIEQYPVAQRTLALEQLLSFVAVAFNEEQKIRLSAVLIRVLQPDLDDRVLGSKVVLQFADAAGISSDLLKQAHGLLKQILAQ